MRISAVRYLFRVSPARRQVHLESGHEIQSQGRKAKSLLISLVQKVIEPPVDFDALGQVIGEARVHQFVSVISEDALKRQHGYGIYQLARKSPIVWLDVQHRAANRPIQVEH